ncbi:MAG: LytTR family DNA-binding domain-containing protein [Desulfobacterales bacterium]|nr:LytTR family DNA-binding domain-containing protein [Desulfobacterales bacterium]
MYNILVVDDEKPARDKTIRFIRERKVDVRITEAENGEQALDIINEIAPDLVFLDIQMPGLTGFDVLEQLPREKKPPIIFVTAYDEYAVKAFEVHALDYLLKPFDYERFDKAFQRALNATGRKSELTDKIELLINHLSKRKDYTDRIAIKDGERISFIQTRDIQHIKAQGKYLEIVTQNSQYLIRKTMQAIQNQLKPDVFFRIHKSYIVNITYVKEFHTLFHGDYTVILTDGTELRMSRNYSPMVLSKLS